MLKNKRLIIPIIVIILLFIGYGTYLFIENYNTKKNYNVSSKMKIKRKYYDLVVDNVNMYMYQNKYHISFSLTNNSSKTFNNKSLNLVFINDNGDVINKYKFSANSIESKEEKIDIIIDNKDIDAYNFLIEKS